MLYAVRDLCELGSLLDRDRQQSLADRCHNLPNSSYLPSRGGAMPNFPEVVVQQLEVLGEGWVPVKQISGWVVGLQKTTMQRDGM